MRKKYNTYLFCNDDGDSILLEESPIGWDAVKFNLIRDLTYLGIMKSISIEYSFVGDGFRFLQSKRLKYGMDVDIMVRQYIANPNTWLFDGKLNQENFVEDRKGRKYRVDIVQSSFVQNFQNREDVKVNVLNNIGLDRQAVTPAALKNCLFRGKQIEFFSQFTGSSLVAPEIYHHILPFQLIVNGNPGVKQVSNIYPDTWNPYVPIAAGDPGNEYPYAGNPSPLGVLENAFYVNTLTENQTVNINWSFNATFNYLGATLSGSEENWVVYKYILHNEDGTPVELLWYNLFQIRTNGESINMDFNFSSTIEFEPGQYVVLVCERWIQFALTAYRPGTGPEMDDAGSVRTEITYNTMSLTVNTASIISDTTHPVILSHELFSNIIAQINGGILYSDVFGRIDLGYYSDGEFAYLGITKGELLRGIDPGEVQIPTSMRDAFKSYHSVICLGAIISEGQIRIDPLDVLFNQEIAVNLGEVSELEITPSKEFLFNSVKAGYPKNEYEEENGRDEFNTEYQYTNAFKSVKKELDLKSVYNGDGYGIEFARRQSVINTGTADSRYDDQIFFVDIIKDGDTLMTRRLEGILDISGVFSPETVINARIATGQNMLRHRKYLNIPLHRKDKNLFFQTKDKNTSLHLVTDLGVTDDGQDISLGEASYFLPHQPRFRCPIRIDQLFDILANPLGIIQYSYKKEPFFDLLMEADSEIDKAPTEWRTLGTRDTPVEVEDVETGDLLMHDNGLSDTVGHDNLDDDNLLYQ